MSNMMENVKTLNSVTRTMIFLAMTGCVGYGGFVGYNNYIKPGIDAKEAIAERDQLRDQLQQKEQDLLKTQEENGRLKTSMQLLKVDQRKAKVKVLAIGENEKGESIVNVRFTEFDQFGEPIGEPRDYELRGDKMYVDCWVVKFGDKYIEQADALRSASLCVFKGIYGNLDGPEGSKSLDAESSDAYPSVYISDERTAFAEMIWNDFWRLANDRDSQEDYGIRAIHGQANYLKVEEGRTYEVSVRSSGAASLIPVND